METIVVKIPEFIHLRLDFLQFISEYLLKYLINMKTIQILLIIMLGSILSTNAQQKDIPVSELPKEVKQVLIEYVNILSTSKTLDECADRFLTIAGGGLVNPAGTALRSSVKPYSLKKDFTNIKFYKIPVKIIRVAKTRTGQAGYGTSAIAGDWYKIYIAKKDDSQPAPVHIVYPENHALIKTPKVIQGGSF